MYIFRVPKQVHEPVPGQALERASGLPERPREPLQKPPGLRRPLGLARDGIPRLVAARNDQEVDLLVGLERLVLKFVLATYRYVQRMIIWLPLTSTIYLVLRFSRFMNLFHFFNRT